MEKEIYTIIKMIKNKEVDMKVIGKMIKGKEKENYIGKMVINIKVILKMINFKEKE